jgi:hypothetical protein
MMQSKKAHTQQAGHAQEAIRENVRGQMAAFNWRQSRRLLVIDMDGKVTWDEGITPAVIMQSQLPDRVAILALWYATHPDQI